MSPNVGDMLESFQRLRDKIEANNYKMNTIQDAYHQIAVNVQQCSEYREKLEQISTEQKKEQRKALIAQIRMEQRYSGALFAENSELQLAIQTHRKAMDEIMGKYREQIKLLNRIKELEAVQQQQRTLHNESLLKRHTYLTDVRSNIPVVVSKICDDDLALIEKQDALIARLKLENARMRRLLNARNNEDNV